VTRDYIISYEIMVFMPS